MRFKGALAALPLCAALGGCTWFLGDLDALLPDPPPLAQAAPRLYCVSAEPTLLPPGATTRVAIEVGFEDWNEDVGTATATIRRGVRKLTGNFELAPSTVTLEAALQTQGRFGRVRYEIEFSVPAAATGAIEVTVAVVDAAGLASEPLAVTLALQPVGPPPDPVNPLCEKGDLP